MRNDNLYLIVLLFAPMSLASFGGGMAIVSEVQHQAVVVQHWMTDREFMNLFAISRAAPGPGSMLVTLIGWHVAGWSGALAATAAIFLPSAILCAVLAFFWNRHREKSWLKLLERSLVPIGVGCLLAGMLTVAAIVSDSPVAIAIAAGSVCICLLRPQSHPLILMAVGAAINVVGFATTS